MYYNVTLSLYCVGLYGTMEYSASRIMWTTNVSGCKWSRYVQILSIWKGFHPDIDFRISCSV